MNHDGESINKSPCFLGESIAIMIHITKMSVRFRGTHKIHHVKPVSLSKVEVKDISYSTKVRIERTSKTTAATIPFSAIKGYVYRAGKSTKLIYLSKSTSNSEKSYSSRSNKKIVLYVQVNDCTLNTLKNTFTDQKLLHWLNIWYKILVLCYIFKSAAQNLSCTLLQVKVLF